MEPGINVTRIDAHIWAITVRGFNGSHTSKLLRSGVGASRDEAAAGLFPRHQTSLRVPASLRPNLDLDLWPRYSDGLPAVDVDAYLTLDVRLAWRPVKDLELSLVGRNLLGSPHQEFVETQTGLLAADVRASIYGRLEWRFRDSSQPVLAPHLPCVEAYLPMMSDIHRIHVKQTRALAALTTLTLISTSPSAQDDAYFDLPLGELLSLETTSVAKKAQSIAESAAAVFVITQEDIRRSGVTHVADALRMVPGVQVAQINANSWAISARGFNGRFANKLLVMVDGRTVYDPLFSGVYWDVQDMVLENIERIEVIRGPGSTLWGANAVNGVINIITKSANETQGGLLSVVAGNEERGILSLRYGGSLGDSGSYRVYGKLFERDGFSWMNGQDTSDDWRAGRVGFRADLSLGPRDTLMIEGEYYDGTSGQTSLTYSTEAPYYGVDQDDEQSVSGGHFLAKWSRAVSDTADFSLQAYYDLTNRDWSVASERRDTFDIEAQLRETGWSGHDVLVGLGYRYTQDEIHSLGPEVQIPVLELYPERRGDQVFNFFVQDDISLIEDRLVLTLGSKFEHNDYTGFEYQPNIRLLWRPDARQSAWASVTRAVSTPSRWQSDGVLTSYIQLPQSESNPFSLPLQIRLLGSPEAESEVLLAYELGYRMRATDTFSFDVALYYNDYQNLVGATAGAVVCDDGGQPLSCLLFPSSATSLVSLNPGNNDTKAQAQGVEVALDWRPHYKWRLQTAYSLQRMSVDSPSGTETLFLAESNPEQQLSLRVSFNPRPTVDLDLWLRYVDGLPGFRGGFDRLRVSSYTELDLRAAWRMTRDLELAVVGRNLLDSRHAEFYSELNDVYLTGIERSVYAKLTWRF